MSNNDHPHQEQQRTLTVRQRNRPPKMTLAEYAAREQLICDEASRADYEVGYGKPPKDRQFKKGQSGNSKGRRKGSKGLRTYYRKEREAKVSVTEGGRQKKMPKVQALVKHLINKALSGDARARSDVMKLEQQIETALAGDKAAKRAQPISQSERDARNQDIIKFFKDRLKQQEP